MSKLGGGEVRLAVILGLIAALPVFAPAPARAADRTVLISAQSARCLLENHGKYMSQRKPTLIIFLPVCPNANPSSEQLAQFNQNVRIRRNRSAPELTNLLILSDPELRCVVRQLRAVRARLDGRAPVRIAIKTC
ncbi:MAG TPA: hypothetical protein VEA60_12405 [Allosphingosinicella sp.]|nr:hypothetical protein [Allosphingosinicella sp.]